MAAKVREPKTSRTLGRKLVLILLSFLPMILGVSIIRIKWIAALMVNLLYLLFSAGGCWVGSRWFRLIRLDDDSSVDSDEESLPNNRIDTLAMITAIIIGFGIFFLFRMLMTHAMVRAFDSFMTTSHDDD